MVYLCGWPAFICLYTLSRFCLRFTQYISTVNLFFKHNLSMFCVFICFHRHNCSFITFTGSKLTLIWRNNRVFQCKQSIRLRIIRVLCLNTEAEEVLRRSSLGITEAEEVFTWNYNLNLFFKFICLSLLHKIPHISIITNTTYCHREHANRMKQNRLSINIHWHREILPVFLQVRSQ